MVRQRAETALKKEAEQEKEELGRLERQLEEADSITNVPEDSALDAAQFLDREPRS